MIILVDNKNNDNNNKMIMKTMIEAIHLRSMNNMIIKISKYRDLEIEIQKMWHLKAIVMPVVVGALGMTKKTTEDHIKRIPGKPCLQELQKVVLNGMAHLLRRVLPM